MSNQKFIVDLLLNLSKQINELNDDEIKGLMYGKYELTIKIQKVKSANTILPILSKDKLVELSKQLQSTHNREEGLKILDNELKTKKELESLARYLDILILKQDKIDQIRIKIVEATIGAILRSEAIQGEKNSNTH